jgi:pimeloyl-ACP methyl ester carboxylesterase
MATGSQPCCTKPHEGVATCDGSVRFAWQASLRLCSRPATLAPTRLWCLCTAVPAAPTTWQPFLEPVGEVARVVAVGMPGFGQADKPAAFDYTVTGYARHLGGCLEALGSRRAHLVLHDFGGPWGLQWAIEHPDAFATATLINTGVWSDYRWHIYARIWRIPVLGEAFMASITRRGFHFAVQFPNPRRLPHAFVDRMYDDYDWRTRRAILRPYRATNPTALGYAQARALRSLSRPALVIWGQRDRYLPLWLAEGQRDAFPGARIVVLENCGRFPFADDADAVTNQLVPFVREHVAA